MFSGGREGVYWERKVNKLAQNNTSKLPQVSHLVLELPWQCKAICLIVFYLCKCTGKPQSMLKKKFIKNQFK